MSNGLSLHPRPEETIEGVGAALLSNATTCLEVLDGCLKRIDEWEPKVRAWVVIDHERAREQARERDAELSDVVIRSPLHGIPFGIKDIIDVQGLPTAAGFAPWRDRMAEKDAEIVARLRLAGAVILGKTATTQFAWVDPPITRNPWNLDRTPGGSSSGSAVAVATGMCLGAIGTQTGGSIVRPASFCGVIGYKPWHGQLNEMGILPFAPSLDHPGPFARTIEGTRLILGELDSFKEFQSIDILDAFFRRAELSSRAERDAVRPEHPAFYRPRGLFDRRADPEMLDAFEKALAALIDAGAEVFDLPEERIDFEHCLVDHRLVMAAEAAAGHESRFGRHRSSYAPHIAALVEEGLAIRATDYFRAKVAQQGHREVEYLLITPATVGSAPDTTTTGNPCFNSPFSFFGWPAINVPFALSPDGLPLSIQLVKSRMTKQPLFETAAWCYDVLKAAFPEGSVAS
jgi:Asp-tRNA(Asn)/Glu-tRNA(Gln) amidotransferase A subunit family amidase